MCSLQNLINSERAGVLEPDWLHSWDVFMKAKHESKTFITFEVYQTLCCQLCLILQKLFDDKHEHVMFVKNVLCLNTYNLIETPLKVNSRIQSLFN